MDIKFCRQPEPEEGHRDLRSTLFVVGVVQGRVGQHGLSNAGKIHPVPNSQPEAAGDDCQQVSRGLDDVVPELVLGASSGTAFVCCKGRMGYEWLRLKK